MSGARRWCWTCKKFLSQPSEILFASLGADTVLFCQSLWASLPLALSVMPHHQTRRAVVEPTLCALGSPEIQLLRGRSTLRTGSVFVHDSLGNGHGGRGEGRRQGTAVTHQTVLGIPQRSSVREECRGGERFIQVLCLPALCVSMQLSLVAFDSCL